MDGRRAGCAHAGPTHAAAALTVAVVGALAAWLAVTAALLAPQLRGRAVPVMWAGFDVLALADAGWRRPVWQWEAARCALICVAAALAIALRGPVAPVAVVAAAIPSVAVRIRADAAWRRARTASTRLVRTAEATMRAGGSLPEALRRGVDACDDGLASRAFSDALRAFDLGAPLDAALRTAAPRADARARVALETLAIGVSSRLSNERAVSLLSAIADRLSFEERLEEEIRARTNGLRLQVVLLALVVPGMAMYLAATVPPLAATLGSPLGRTVLVPAALALEIIGVVASRRAVSGVTA